MLRKIMPVVLMLIGTGAGVGAGLALRPTPEPEAPHPPETSAISDKPANLDFVKLPSQFVVPLLESGRVAALVVLSLSLEIVPGQAEMVHAREPKLRDEFLRVLFEHANTGGFRGTFTDASNLVVLRRALKEAAVKVLGEQVSDVLITDIVRQDS